jgi:putative membrane protein
MRSVVWVLVVLIGLAVVFGLVGPLIISSAYGQASPHPYGYGGMMGPWMMGGFGWWGMLVPLLLLILLVVGVVWLVLAGTRGLGPAGQSPPLESPLDILRRRYASGEITKKQFEDMKRDLGV